MRQSPTTWFRVAWALVFAAASQVFAAKFSAKIFDGLRRPVPDVDVELYWIKSESQDKAQKIPLFKTASDRNGAAHGRYDEKSVPPGESLWVELAKDGYQGYSTGVGSEYVLERQFHASDLARIAELTGGDQKTELREFLAGDFDDGKVNPYELVFFDERRFRPALLSLVTDPAVGGAASDLLAFIGVPEDLRVVVRHAPTPHKKLFKDRWAYGVVSALLEPTIEAEWAFLRKCALGKYQDAWIDAGAIKALRLVGSPRSLEILQEVRKKNTDREELADAAIRYIQSNPPQLADRDIVEAGKRVALAIRIGDWKGNSKPRYNKEGDMALIDCEFTAGRDLLIHAATFHRVGEVWKLRGVRETMQALLAFSPETNPAKEQE
jgi:hypothetical protein